GETACHGYIKDKIQLSYHGISFFCHVLITYRAHLRYKSCLEIHFKTCKQQLDSAEAARNKSCRLSTGGEAFYESRGLCERNEKSCVDRGHEMILVILFQVFYCGFNC